MKTNLFAMGILLGAVALACDSTVPANSDGASGFGTAGSGGGPAIVGSGGTAQGDTTGAPGVALSALSLIEAPAPTRTFIWGTIDVTAPGFVGPPRDELTVGLGLDNSVRYLSWKTLPMLPKTYGDAPSDFPLSGSRSVDLTPSISDDYTATALDSAASANHFLLREHVVTSQGLNDYVESIEGTPSGNGWSVVYSLEGKLHGSSINAHGQGVIYAGDPKASSPVAGQPSLWSAPVELTAPGFSGPPVDHLTVALDGSGQIRWFSFDRLMRQVSFSSTTDGMPAGGITLASEGSVTFDNVVPATATHFVTRYQVHSTDKQHDYTEGLDGTRQGDTLTLRYFISGKWWGATIDGHAAGTLVPASP